MAEPIESLKQPDLEQQELKETPASSDFNLLGVMGHLGSGFLHGASDPFRGVAQIATGGPAGSRTHAAEGTNTANIRAEQLGEFGGQAFDFILAIKSAKSGIGLVDKKLGLHLFERLGENGMVALQRKLAITTGGAMGFLHTTENGGLDLAQRGKNGLVGAGSVSLFEASSALSASRGLKGSFGKDTARMGLSGFVAGAGTVEAQTRFDTGHGAAWGDIGGSGIMWGIAGAMLHAGGVGVMRVRNNWMSVRPGEPISGENPVATKTEPTAERAAETAPQKAVENPTEPPLVYREGYYYDAEFGGWVKESPDRAILHFESGGSAVYYREGVQAGRNTRGTTATLPDGTRFNENSEGIQANSKDGTYYRESGYGDWEIRPNGAPQVRHYADGTEIVKYPDGTVVDTWPDGTQRKFPSDHLKSVEPGAPTPAFDAAQAALEKAGITPEQIAAAAVPENQLGQGGNATVYKVPGLSDYVIKVMDWGFDKATKVNATPIRPVPDFFPGENVGQPVAIMDNGRVQILRKQPGVASGGPRDIAALGADLANQRYLEHLRTVANMPQEAYDKFAAMLLRLRERGIGFDPSKANNLLVDSANQSFNVVDLNVSPGTYPTASYMADVLLDARFVTTGNTGLVPPLGLYNQIIEKILIAAERTKLPVGLQVDYAWLTGRTAEAQARRDAAAAAYQGKRPSIFQRMVDEVESLLRPLSAEKPPSDLTPPVEQN